MARVTLSGDQDEDRDALVEVLAKLQDSFVVFCDDPGADEVGDLSAWTREAYGLCDEIELQYGLSLGRRIISSAWTEVKR